MSLKRKALLIATIATIIISYGIAFRFILKSPNASLSIFSTSKYKGNQLANGSSPFRDCFGIGLFNGNARLTVKNGANSDAVVCLFDMNLGRTIRNEYVQKNTTHTIYNIRQGYYKIRVFFGNDWNPEIQNPCGVKGYFESDANFSEFDDVQYFEDNFNGYSIATITLYTISGGNASTSGISQSQFFGN